MKSCGGMANIARGKQVSASNGFRGPADKRAIHDDFIACSNVSRDKFMLRRHIRDQNEFFAREADPFPFTQFCQSHKNVVFRVQSQHRTWLSFTTWHLCVSSSNSCPLILAAPP